MPYSGNPASSRTDAIRFLVGDTDTTRQLLLDAEVAYAAASYLVDAIAAAQLADTLAAKYSVQVDTEILDLKIARSQKAKQYRDLAVTLRANAWRSPQLLLVSAPYAGGLVVQEKLDEQSNIDKTHPSFRRGMHDYVHDAANSSSIVSPIP